MSNLTPFETEKTATLAPNLDMGARNDLTMTPEQNDIMDLLEGRVIRAPLPGLAKASQTTSLQSDVVLASLGGLSLTAGLVAIFFMAALGAVMLVVGALLCVAAYEHAITSDAADLKAQSHLELQRQQSRQDS